MKMWKRHLWIVVAVACVLLTGLLAWGGTLAGADEGTSLAAEPLSAVVEEESTAVAAAPQTAAPIQAAAQPQAAVQAAAAPAKADSVEAAEPQTEAPAQAAASVEADASEQVAAPAEAPAQPAAAAEQTAVPAQAAAEQPAAPAQTSDASQSAAAEAVPAQVNMPAQKLVQTLADGTIVTVEAAEGVLPEGTTIEAKIVDSQNVVDAVTAEVQKGDAAAEATIKAIDITLFDKDGNEIQPSGKLTVTFSKTGMDSDNISVYHVTTPNDEPVDNVAADDLAVEQVDTTKAEADEQVFEADHFSIYAIVDTTANPRLKVTFYQKDKTTEAASMLVKRSNTVTDIASIVYDPGAGTLEANEVFRGWTTDADYTEATESMSIEDVRTLVQQTAAKLADGADGTELKLYPMVFRSLNVTYLDENRTSLGTDTLLVPVSQTGSVDYTVNKEYTPKDDEHDFQGWNVSEGTTNIEGYAAGTTYTNGTAIKISGDVTFSVNAPAGHWLVFDENGKGATYNAPQFVKSDDVTQKPVDDTKMVRDGYTFGGWYTDAKCSDGNEFSFGGKLTEKTTIYAKWTAKAQADYTVLIWKQNVSGTGYDFAESVKLSGKVNDKVSSVVSHGSGNSAYASVDNTNKQYTGFHLNKFDENVTIATEGNSVVNVYYDRNTVTLTFMTWSGWGWGWGGSWTTHQTMTGLYGSTLSANGYTWPEQYRWQAKGDNRGNTSGTVTTFLDAFIPSDGSTTGQTFYGNELSGNSTIRFYKQNVDGNGYTLANIVTSSGGSFIITDKYNDFKAVSYNRDYAGWESAGDKNPSDGSYNTVPSGYSSLDIRFDRLTYNLLYCDGTFVDGNNNPVEGYSGGATLNDVDDITYESDMSSYNSGGSNYYAPTKEGFVFEGWYIDDACTQPYTFTTMPAGITVYAKWRQVQYRVFLHPNAGTDSTLDWGSASQAMNFRISYNATASLPTGQRAEYEFVGWYTDAACTKLYSTDTKLNDQTVTAAYDKSADMTDVMDKWGNGATTNKDAENNRFWITRKLDLYAKWRAKLVGAKGIGVLYDANGGTNAPTDSQLYLDSADAVAGAASTAPSGKQFEYWVLQTWDATKGAYVDTETKVYPGDSFEVLKANARDEELEGSTEDDPKHSYTVQLRAEYGDKGSKLYTHYTFNANGGTLNDGTSTVESVGHQVEVNGNVQFPTAPVRTGYTFKGWCNEQLQPTTDLTGKTLLDTTKTYAADALDGYAWNATATWTDGTASGTGDNILYAVWEPMPVTLTLTKQIEGSQADMTKTFTFTISVVHNGTTYTGTATLGDDRSKTFSVLTAEDGSTYTLRYGDTVTITEETAAGYATTYQVKAGTSGNGASGTVELDGFNVSLDSTANNASYTSSVTFTNTKTDVPITGIKDAVGSGILPLVAGIGTGIAALGVAITRRRRDGWGE